MTYASKLIERVHKCGRMLNDEEKIGDALKRLEALPVTMEVLKETGVGKVIGKLRSHEKHGERAKAIIEGWKKAAAESDGAPIVSSWCKTNSDSQRLGKRSVDLEIELNRPKRMKPLPTLRPEDIAPPTAVMSVYQTQPNNGLKLKISRSRPAAFAPQSPPALNGYDPGVFTRKTYRPLVNRRKGTVAISNGEVPRLFDICMKTCANNIDSIDETGDIPYDILRPILEKCSEVQLARIESKNAYLKEDTDHLWEKHCERLFPNSQRLEEDDEEWRECFERLIRERDERLRSVSLRINNATKASLGPQRKTMEITAITPRAARKKQILNGIYSARDQHIPSAVEVSKARKEISDTGDKTSFKQLPLSVRNTSTHTTIKTGNNRVGPPKKAPLMAKVLKILKGRPRYKK